jgi:hypothetical protein
MKQLFHFKVLSFVTILVCLNAVALGQGAVQPGQFRFVNAAGLSGKLSLTIDTLKLKPEGFATGDTTGLIGILPGPKHVIVANTEAGTATATVMVQPNDSNTIIAYCKITRDPGTNAPKKSLQLLQRANPSTSSGRHFQLMYVSSQPSVDVVINGAPKRINAMREVNEQELPGPKIKVEQAGRKVVEFDSPQAGNFFVVLFDDAAGKLAGVVLADYK